MTNLQSRGNSPIDEVWSYGFSFVGFAREVHGWPSMDEFEILLPGSQGGVG